MPMTNAQESILTELIKEGHKAKLSTSGWLLVSGKRTTWQEGFWIAFLGWNKKMNPPKIIKQ